MWLFNWWQKRKFHTVAYWRWSIVWIDECGMEIPGGATVGFWIFQENGYGKRRFCTTNKPCEVSRIPGYAKCKLWVETGIYPAGAQLVGG